MKIPQSTYRLQFNREFTFNDSARIIDYLAELGISDIYASPVFKAVKGSMHGYDVVDHNFLNPDQGTESEFKELQAARKSAGLGWIQDIVPNHMAFHSENKILLDLLENGENSEFRNFFDIDWNHTHESLRGRVLIPFLGKFYSECLESGEIKIVYEEGSLFVKYYDHMFPLSLASYPVVFGGPDPDNGGISGSENPLLFKLRGVLHQFTMLAGSASDSVGYDRTGHAKSMLQSLYLTEPLVRDHMDERLSFYDSGGSAENEDRLDSLLEKQMYRLSFWKVAAEEINYRRFFNINGLISLRIEDDKIFNYTNRLLLKMIQSGDITGIRIDHVDGLYNPEEYLRRLREIAGDLYIVVEKILNSREVLPEVWGVHGTTGYDFMNQLNGLFCKRENDREFSRIYFNFTHQNFRYDELIAEKKRMIIEKHMTGDVDNLASLLKQFSGSDRYGRDITIHGLRNALVELIAFFPVYRTYINSDTISIADSGYIRLAFEKARKQAPEYSFEFDFLEKCLTLQYIEKMDSVKTSGLIHFIMRFQQYTGPFMAKGFEDTVLYILNRLISLNEVGGNPAVFGITTGQYTEYIQARSASHRYSMNATSTHDSKRGEDVRSRINVLSEFPSEWMSAVRQWGRINHVRKRRGASGPVPDRNDEYFLYQTLIGTFPDKLDNYDEYVRRIRDYMIKSVREAKVHTAWIKPDNEYEENLLLFINRILLPLEGNRFLEQFVPFQRKIAYYGIFNSLSQVILKITSPGVADFYQGTELWDYRLVDPDNRTKVDFTIRINHLEYIKDRENRDLAALLNELWDTRADGRIKLYCIRRLLQLRNNMKELFGNGEYIPLETCGRYSNSVIAFMRKHGDEAAIVIAPRFLTSVVREGELPVGDVWQDTCFTLPESCNSVMKDALTGFEIRVYGVMMLREMMTVFPGTVLTGKIQQ